jgi:RNA polymerase sigma-70 factor (ECF subfamily)
VNARSPALEQMETREASFDFEAFFHAHYQRIARAVGRVVGDHARAEDLAVEAFWKLWRNPRAQGEKAGGWVYRTAVRLALNELRRQARSTRYELLSGQVVNPGRQSPTPEEAHAAAERREQVRRVLAALDARQAELLLLRSGGLRYGELAAAMDVNPASMGTLISRAQQAFRKEYLKQFGETK